MFYKITSPVNMVKDLTLIIRSDSTNYAGGDIPQIFSKINSIKIFNEKAKKNDVLLNASNIFSDINLEESNKTIFNNILNSKLPLIQAFTSTSVLSTSKWFSKYFPYYNDNYQKLLYGLSKLTKNEVLSPNVIRKIFNGITQYVLQKSPFFGDESIINSVTGEKITITSLDKRGYYHYLFMKDLKKILETHPEFAELNFIKRLSFIPKGFSKYNKIIFRNAGKMTPYLKELFELEQNSLIFSTDKLAVKLMQDLVRYTYYTSGLGFSNDSMGYLLTSTVKEALPSHLDINGNQGKSYIEVMFDLLTNSTDFSLFSKLFIQNNVNLHSLIPSMDNTNIVFLQNSQILDVLNISKKDLEMSKNKAIFRAQNLDIETNKVVSEPHKYIKFNYLNEWVLYEFVGENTEDSEGLVYNRIPVLAGNEYEELSSIHNDVQPVLDVKYFNENFADILEQPQFSDNIEESTYNQNLEEEAFSTYDKSITEGIEEGSIQQSGLYAIQQIDFRDADNNKACK
jgi:hypothetical protein